MDPEPLDDMGLMKKVLQSIGGDKAMRRHLECLDDYEASHFSCLIWGFVFD